MGKIILILIFLCSLNFLLSQDFPDSLSMVKRDGKYRFYKQDHQVRFVDLRKIIKTDKEAKRYYTWANNSRIGADVFTGGAFLLFTSSLCEKYIEKKSIDLLVVSVISTGLLLATIPMRIGQFKFSSYAIDAYNDNLHKNNPTSMNLIFKLNKNVIGIVVLF